MTFLSGVVGGGGGVPEESPYDVSRGQTRYVTLPLLKHKPYGHKIAIVKWQEATIKA